MRLGCGGVLVWGCEVRWWCGGVGSGGGVGVEVRWGGVWCEGGEIRSGCGWSI